MLETTLECCSAKDVKKGGRVESVDIGICA